MRVEGPLISSKQFRSIRKNILRQINLIEPWICKTFTTI